MSEYRKEVTLRHWGTCTESGNIPMGLSDFIEALTEAENEVEHQLRDSAHIDAEPDYEHGEHYAAVRVIYTRDMTPDEIRDDKAQEIARLEDNIARYGDDVNRSLAELSALTADD